ncbi:hypothetical protein Tco_1407714 [Tanacetum coccineum]
MYDVTPPDTYSDGTLFGDVADWYQSRVIENQVMAFSVISISSDSSKESVETSNARVILFGTIPTTVLATAPTADLPVIHDDTPLIPTNTPTISPIVPTIPSIAPIIQYTLHSFTLILLTVTLLIHHHHRIRMRLLLLGG